MINNSKLKNMFKLSSKVTVYVPSTTGIDKEIDNSKYVSDVASLLSRNFGGSTSTPAIGYWESPTAGLVKEKTTMVFAYCKDSDLEAHIDEVIDFCSNMKEELGQDAIGMEINGEMYFL